MHTSFGRNISRYLGHEIRRVRDSKTQGKTQSCPQMDLASSIITQVAREGEPLGNGYILTKDDKSIRGSIKKKSKSDSQNATLRSMLCCFGRPKRKPPLNGKPPQENWLPTQNGKTDHTPPPSPKVDTKTPESPIANGELRYLLPAKSQSLSHKKCAVIDLDETLVHSSFKPISNADFIVPVEIDGTIHQVYVLKRPHVDTYLQRMGEMYECVLFTASLAKYADPVADLLDKQGVFTSRLFRESCVFHRGNYVKDLSLIGRELNKVIIIDNSPASYIFHPDNAVPVISWFDDPSDTELLDLLPFLEAIAESEDVYSVLRSHGFTSHAKETTASIQQQQQLQLQLQQQQQQTSDEDEEER